MKKIALSLLVIAASGAYVWQQWSNAPSPGLLDLTFPGGDASTVPGLLSSPSQAEPNTGQAEPANVLQPAKASLSAMRARPVAARVDLSSMQSSESPAVFTRVATTLTASGGYVDGTFTGPVTDAYYGPMQIQAVIQGGRLVNIGVLKWPNDRRTSVRINQQAIPMLRDEVIQAQSANVDIVTGATLTSEAFIQSIGGALRQSQTH